MSTDVVAKTPQNNNNSQTSKVVTTSKSGKTTTTTTTTVVTSKTQVVSSSARPSFKSKDFTTMVYKAYPQSGSSVSLMGTRYRLTIKGDQMTSTLPYYGRVTSGNGSEGLTFSAKISDYKEVAGKRDSKTITFTARTNEDKYTFTIDVDSAGDVYIYVKPTNKQSIAFDGELAN